MNYEALKGNFYSKVHRHELIGFVSGERSSNYEALARIVDTKLSNIESNTPLSSTKTASYEALTLNLLSKSKRHELLGYVNANKEALLEALTFVSDEQESATESLITVYPKKSPRIIIARKSSNDTGDPAAYSRLVARGYDVTLNLSATVADCREYDIVVIDCEFWSADEHNTFVQDLWNDGQKVLVSGNDTNDMFYQTGNSVLLNAPNIGTTEPAEDVYHAILEGWTNTTNSTDTGVIRDSVVDGVRILGYAVNYDTSAPTLLEYINTTSGGIIIHWHNAFLYTSTDDVILFTNIIKYLSSFNDEPQEVFESLEGIQIQKSKRYELLAFIRVNLNVFFEALTFVIEDKSTLLEALSFIAVESIGNYEALKTNIIQKTKRYELLLTIRIQKENNIEALGYIEDEASSNLEALVLTTNNNPNNYEALQTANIAKAERYELLGFVYGNRGGTLEALQYVAATVDPNYEATVAFFIRNAPHRYELIGFVRQSAIVNLESLLTVGEAEINYESLVGVIVNEELPLEALGLVVKNQKGQYEVHPFLQQTYVQCSGELKLDVDYNEESCVVTDVDDETNPVNETTGVIEDRETRYSLDGSADTNYTPEAQADTRYTVESRNSPDYTNDVTHTPTFDDEE